MRLIVNVLDGDGAQRPEFVPDLEETLTADPQLGSAEIRLITPPPEPQTLGSGVELIEIFLSDVTLPLLVHALYDELRSWRRTGQGDVRVTITRTDLPDGTKTETVSVAGPVDDVVRAVESGLK